MYIIVDKMSIFFYFIGLGIFLDVIDDEYKINCCGVVEFWEFYVKINLGIV